MGKMPTDSLGKSSELKLHCFCLFDAYSMPNDMCSVWSNQTFWQMWIKIKFRRFCHESTKSIFYWIKVCFAARFEDHLTVYDCFQCVKSGPRKAFFSPKITSRRLFC